MRVLALVVPLAKTLLRASSSSFVFQALEQARPQFKQGSMREKVSNLD